MKTYYHGNLPHIQPIGAAFFATFRLAGSLPREKIIHLKENYNQRLAEIYQIKDVKQKNILLMNIRNEYFEEFEEMLHKLKSGPHYLKEIDIINIIGDELKKHDGKLYELIAYCIMSNHVHLVIDTEIQIRDEDDWSELEHTYKPLDKILKQIKGATSRYINIYLKRTGQFWERESFDIYIRNEKMLNNVIAYTLNNPVKAELVPTWEDYPGNYFVEEG